MIDFFKYIADFISSGIYDLLTQFTAYIISQMSIAMITFKISALTFFWDVAAQVLDDFGVGNYISALFGYLPADFKSVVDFFGIPAAMQTLINAFATRYILNFVGL